jgi:hypothetical protein
MTMPKPNTSLVLPTRNGLEVDLESGFVLLRALKSVGATDGGASLDAEGLLRRLLAALADDARDAAGQHASLAGIGALLVQLRSVDSDLTAAVRAQILAFPQVQRVYRRLAELQGDPPWLFRVGSDGSVRLVTLKDVVDHPPLELKWDTQSRTTGSSSAPTFELNAQAGAGLKLDVLAVAGANQTFALVPELPVSEVAVVVSASGAISGSLSLGASAPVVASASAALQAETSLAYLYQLEEGKTVVAALDLMRSDLPNPIDLGSIFTQLDPPSISGLRRIEFAVGYGGRLSLALNLDRATSWTSTFSGPAGAITATQALAASASFSFGFGRSITRKVTLEKSAEGRLLLSSRVSRERTTEVAAGFSLGFAIDGLDDWAKAWLGKVMPAVPASLQQVLTDFSNPGQRLADAIESRISNPLVEKIALLLAGQGTAEDAASTIADRLLAPVQRAFDSVENLFDAASDAPAEVLGRVISAIRDASGGVVSAEKLQELLAQPVVDAWGDVIGSLRTRVSDVWTNQIQGKTKQQIAKLLEPLTDALGASAVVAKVEDLVGLVQGYLKRYGEWRASVFAEVERSLSGRIGFAVKYSRKDAIESWLSRGYEIDLSGLSVAGWKKADAQYRRLLSGSVSDTVDFGGAPVKVVSEEVGASGSTERGLTATLDLLPFQAVYSAQRNAKAQLFASPSGEIRSATGELDNSETAKSPKTAWTVRFAGSLNLADSRLRGSASGLPMGIEVSAAFAEMDSADLRGLFASLLVANSLGKVPLFDAAVLDQIAQRVGQAANGKKTQAVRLSFGVMFPAEALEDFVAGIGSAAARSRWSQLLLASRDQIVKSELAPAISVAVEVLSKALGRPATTDELFPAFASEPGEVLPRLKIDLIGSAEIRAGSVPAEPLGNGTLVESARQLKKALLAWDGLQDFARGIRQMPGVVKAAASAIAAAKTDADRTKAVEAGVVSLLDVQSRANSELGWTLDPSDNAFPTKAIAPDTAALFAFVAEVLGAGRVQPPTETMRVWVGAKAKTLADVEWSELKL